MSEVQWQIATLPRAEGVPDQQVTERLTDQEIRELRAGQIHEVGDVSVVVNQIEIGEDGVVLIAARRLPGREEVSRR